MRRVTEIVFAILGAYLVLSMAPMAAAASSSEELVVGSQHSDAQEFSNAKTLDNVSVVGCGDSAYVTLDTASFQDCFEDEAADSGVPNNWEIASDNDGSSNVSTNKAKDGSQSAGIDSGSGRQRIRPSDQPYASNRTSNISTWLYEDAGTGRLGIHVLEGGNRVILVAIKDGDLVYYNGSSFVTISTIPNSNEWVHVDIGKFDTSSDTFAVSWKTASDSGGESGLSMRGDMQNGYDETEVEAASGSSGYFDLFTIGGGGDIGTYVNNHSVTNSEQAKVNLTLSNATATVTISEEGSGTVLNKTTFSANGNHTVTWSSSSADKIETNVTFEKTGSSPTARMDDESILFTNHAPSADNSTATPNATSTNNENVDLSIDVSDQEFSTVQGDNVTVTAYVDGSAVGSKTISSNQTVTFTATGLSDGSHSWHVELEDEYGLTSQSDTFSFEVNHYAPALDNSSAEPQGDAKQSSRDVNLSIPLEDVDFAEDSGDEVAVEFIVDGEVRDTVNVTSNGTVSTTVTVSEGGNHTWHVRATDEYGQTTTSDTFGFQVPSELSVYKETKPSELVDNVPVEIQFYFEGEDDLIVTRNATNGTINMTGLPVDQSFVVVAQDDSGDYYDRRILVESLYETQSVYLLNKSEAAVNQRFELQDYSGDYPKEKSVLLVQRSINDTWKTVEGDRFGATGEFPTTLAKDQRHRLIVLNVETGEREEVGHITPTTDSLKTVKITSDQSIVLEAVDPVVLFGPSTNSVPAIANASIQGEIRNKSATFDSWSIDVIVENTTSGTNTTLYNNTFSSPGGGTDSAKVDLRNRTNHTLYVVMSFTTTDGRTGNVTKVYQIDEHFANEYSALSVADKISKQIDPGSREGIKTLIAVIITTLLTTGSAAAMGMSPELSGLTATASLAAFGVIGWVPYSLVTAAVVTMLAFGGLRRGL